MQHKEKPGQGRFEGVLPAILNAFCRRFFAQNLKDLSIKRKEPLRMVGFPHIFLRGAKNH